MSEQAEQRVAAVLSSVGPSPGAAGRARQERLVIALIAGLAAVMGLPTLGGGFVGGDDHRLLLDHVFVNHPSLDHAVKLFTIPHRDLYQPLPLLTFQMEFAVARALGLFDGDVSGGAGLFHLNNILLHAVNAVFVFLLVRTLHERLHTSDARVWSAATGAWVSARTTRNARAVAAVAAVIFALHPLQTEVVAWTNGRMMLLSTLFALSSLLSFSSFLMRPRAGMAVLTVLLVLLCSISKVRIGLAVLLMLVGLVHRSRLRTAALLLLCGCTAVIAAFAVVNYYTTAGAELFALGQEHLRGPRLVRVLLALASYFQHFVVPLGLASYYPTPPVVTWSDAATWRAILIVTLALWTLAWACRVSRVGRLGTAWFFATIAVTLPWMPARNILWADRYMYLPMVGLAWMTASGLHTLYRRQLAPSAWARRTAAGMAVAAAAVSIGICWHVGVTYNTALAKTLRVARLFPDVPRVWEPVGWTYYSDGKYEQAIECARRELRHDAPAVRSGAFQLLGLSTLRLGRPDEALELLRQAVELDPRSGIARYRLGTTLEEMGQNEEALSWYEDAAEVSPSYNPNLNRLARTLRAVGRLGDARAAYLQALDNNPYEVSAIMGLSELDLLAGERSGYRAAQRRILALLEWMPENVEARVNLGVAYANLGETQKAIETYREALRRDPNHRTGLLNLAQLYLGLGELRQAQPLFDRLVALGPESLAQARAVEEFYLSHHDPAAAVELWRGFLERFPERSIASALLSWAQARSGDFEEARERAENLLSADDRTTRAFALASLAYIELYSERPRQAASLCEALALTAVHGVEARRRLLAAMEHVDHQRSDDPWPLCLAARLLLADQNVDAASIFIDLCEQRCNDPACRQQIRSLRAQLADEGASGSADGESSDPPKRKHIPAKTDGNDR